MSLKSLKTPLPKLTYPKHVSWNVAFQLSLCLRGYRTTLLNKNVAKISLNWEGSTYHTPSSYSDHVLFYHCLCMCVFREKMYRNSQNSAAWSDMDPIKVFLQQELPIHPVPLLCCIQLHTSRLLNMLYDTFSMFTDREKYLNNGASNFKV